MDCLPRFDSRFGDVANEFQRYRSDYPPEFYETFANIFPMSPADYAGFLRSTSYGAAYARTLAEPIHYWSDLESRFAAAAKDDMISVDFRPTLVLACRALG